MSKRKEPPPGQLSLWELDETPQDVPPPTPGRPVLPPGGYYPDGI